jgi:hypothetical protein
MFLPTASRPASNRGVFDRHLEAARKQLGDVADIRNTVIPRRLDHAADVVDAVASDRFSPGTAEPALEPLGGQHVGQTRGSQHAVEVEAKHDVGRGDADVAQGYLGADGPHDSGKNPRQTTASI